MSVQKKLFGEGTHVEFKERIPHRHERFLKDIIAFANTSGGKVILGIKDDTGEVMGLGDQNPFRLSDAISNMVSDSCTPMISMEITPRSIDGKTVLEIEVFPGKMRPYYLVSEGREQSSYIRINGTSRPADTRKLKELELEGQKISYDTMQAIGVPYDEVEVRNLMDSMYRTAYDACRSEEERAEVHPLTIAKMEDFGLLIRNGRDLTPTNGFVLMTNPKGRAARIQCAVFKGKGREEFIDRKEFQDAIQNQVEEAYQFVLRHINRMSTIDGLYRRDRYELPVQSVREIIANAVLHRSYLDSSAIQVSIYDDRLEVDSPGMLYDGLSVREALNGKSKCRNTAIAEAFSYMKIIEGWGTGLPRLYSQCRRMGLPDPGFEEFGDGIKVTIYKKADNFVISDHNATVGSENATVEPGDATVEIENATVGSESATAEADRETSDVQNVGENGIDLTENEKLILSLLRNNPRMTQAELSEKSSVKIGTIKRMLPRLQKQELLRRTGGDRYGKWEVL